MNGQDWEQLTLYPEDSPASRFPWPESSAGSRTRGSCGLKCSALSGSLSRIASSVKTFLESSKLPPGRWSRIWSTQAITSSCCNLRLRLSELGTGGQDAFSLRAPGDGILWPTPCAADGYTAKLSSTQQKGMGRHSLNLPAAIRLYPTPRANEGKDSLTHVPPSRMKSPGECNLTQCIALERLFTTKCAADSTGSTGGGDHRISRPDVSGQLNPEWVEWLMGFPAGWSALEPSAMRSYRSRHTRSSARSRKN